MAKNLTRWLLALAIAGLTMSLLLVHAARAQEMAGAWRGGVAAQAR